MPQETEIVIRYSVARVGRLATDYIHVLVVRPNRKQHLTMHFAFPWSYNVAVQQPDFIVQMYVLYISGTCVVVIFMHVKYKVYTVYACTLAKCILFSLFRS